MYAGRADGRRQAFLAASAQMGQHVSFMEVECSSSDAARAFCSKHGVQSYPTLKLFTSTPRGPARAAAADGAAGEEQLPYTGERSLHGFRDFLAAHVPAVAASAPPAAPPATRAADADSPAAEDAAPPAKPAPQQAAPQPPPPAAAKPVRCSRVCTGRS
jgi:hypothetical protein